MKNYRQLLPVAFGALLFQGCIAFPPLVQVEHKHPPANQAPGPSNEDIMRRLDGIDHRLDQIEKGEAKQ